MRVQVFTRSFNNELYGMMREFIPDQIECVRCEGFDKWFHARDYLYHVIENAAEWVVNLDEDAFVSNWAAIEGIIGHMKNNGYDYAGHPDGGAVISHRCFDWVTMNPFFTIFNAQKIREKLTDKNMIDSCGFHPDMENLKPNWIYGPVNRNGTEPFNGFFYWLIGQFKPLYLKAYMHSDGLSSLSLDLNENAFLYHSWMSREFNTSASQRNRILSLYEKAKSAKQ